MSANEMTNGGVCRRWTDLIKVRIVIYRPSMGPDSLADALHATFVGNHWDESSAESRIKLADVYPLSKPLAGNFAISWLPSQTALTEYV